MPQLIRELKKLNENIEKLVKQNEEKEKPKEGSGA
jgi:hypothetical protein